MKDGEHRQTKVVEVGDAVVWPLPVRTAFKMNSYTVQTIVVTNVINVIYNYIEKTAYGVSKVI